MGKVDSIRGIPCIVCADIEPCGTGARLDPRICLKLTNWINQALSSEEPTEATEEECPICHGSLYTSVKDEDGWNVVVPCPRCKGGKGV